MWSNGCFGGEAGLGKEDVCWPGQRTHCLGMLFGGEEWVLFARDEMVMFRVLVSGEEEIMFTEEVTMFGSLVGSGR